MKIFVKVKTQAFEDRLEKVDDSNYLAFVKARPIDNKANLTLVKLFAKEFNVSAKDVVIKNPTSRKKIIEIKGI